MGLVTVGVTWGIGSVPELRGAGADHIVELAGGAGRLFGSVRVGNGCPAQKSRRRRRRSSAEEVVAVLCSRGSVPSRNAWKRLVSVCDEARSPDLVSTRAKTMPSGTSKSRARRLRSAASMKSIQMGSAARPPVSPRPRTRFSS